MARDSFRSESKLGSVQRNNYDVASASLQRTSVACPYFVHKAQIAVRRLGAELLAPRVLSGSTAKRFYLPSASDGIGRGERSDPQVGEFSIARRRRGLADYCSQDFESASEPAVSCSTFQRST
jgi:hypothetical protein